MMEHDIMRKNNISLSCDWVTLLYSRKLKEHYKPAIMEKNKNQENVESSKSNGGWGAFQGNDKDADMLKAVNKSI